MKPAECDTQLHHKYSGYRILTFCDSAMETRLSPEGLFLNDAHYFNVGVSDYQCIAYNVGGPCKDRDGLAGTCVMLQTLAAQTTALVESN